MNTYKQIIRALVCFFILLAGISATAQSNYDNMSRIERQRRIDQLRYYDPNDMTVSTDSARFIKKDMELFGTKIMEQGRKTALWGGYVGGLSLLTVGILVGAAGEGSAGAALAVAGLGVGTTFIIIGKTKENKGRALYDKSRLIYADASLPVMQYNNLAFGIGVFHNNIDHNNAIGPCLSIRF